MTHLGETARAVLRQLETVGGVENTGAAIARRAGLNADLVTQTLCRLRRRGLVVRNAVGVYQVPVPAAQRLSRREVRLLSVEEELERLDDEDRATAAPARYPKRKTPAFQFGLYPPGYVAQARPMGPNLFRPSIEEGSTQP